MKSSNYFSLFLFFIGVLSFSSQGLRASDDEIIIAKAALNRQLLLLKKLEPLVEPPELGRLTILQKQTSRVLSSLESKGLAHNNTMREYQHLIVAYKYSVAFFKEIETEVSRKWIIEIQKITQEIINARGFDDSPYTQITANIFGQIYQLVLQLKTGNQLPPDLNDKLQALVPQLGQVIAIAQEGDRPRTFKAGTELYKNIFALYPEFEKIAHSQSAFNTIMEIEGLAEFYAEFAQVE